MSGVGHKILTLNMEVMEAEINPHIHKPSGNRSHRVIEAIGMSGRKASLAGQKGDRGALRPPKPLPQAQFTGAAWRGRRPSQLSSEERERTKPELGKVLTLAAQIPRGSQ